MFEPRSVEQIILATAKAAGISPVVMRQMTCRTADVSLARAIAVYIAKKETKLGFRMLAEMFGYFDHKGALHAFNKASCKLAAGDVQALALFAGAGGRISGE